MALTRAFHETVQVRLQQDEAFRDALLFEGVDTLLADDLDAGKAVLPDYIKRHPLSTLSAPNAAI